MKKLIPATIVFSVAISTYALPTYDNFTSYGSAGTWTESEGTPIVSYTTGAPLLGGNAAPSGESWILYTNAPTADLYSNYYYEDFDGYADQNVGVVNYFGIGQPGNSDTPAPNLPAGFPGPLVPGHDTGANSVWTPGWGQTLESSPALENYLGGVGACLQFAGDVPGVTGSEVYVSFFVDVPDCNGSFGAGQSLDHGYSAGFINASELPSPNSTVNQNALPGFSGNNGYNSAAYTSCPLMAKFNIREGSATSYKPGVGYYDGNGNSGSAVNQGTIHFIVMDYEFLGGAGLDAVHVWIDPAGSTFGAATEPSANATSHPTAGYNLPDVGGFFFLANTQDGGATPNSGVIFNSLSIATNWAYVTGGPDFTSYAPASTNIAAGQTLVLNSTAVAGGGVTPTYSWQNSSGPITPGGRYSVGPTGALTIANVQGSDADTYTLSVSTAITTENGVAASSAQTVVTVTAYPAFVSEDGSGLGSGRFTLNFTGQEGASYRIWSSTDISLQPVTSKWNLVTSGTFGSGVNTYTDSAATGKAHYYVITSP